MTVGELKKILATYPDSAQVFVPKNGAKYLWNTYVRTDRRNNNLYLLT